MYLTPFLTDLLIRLLGWCHMKINIVRSLKNSGILFLKLGSIAVLLFLILHIITGFFTYFSLEYSNYALVRGLEKYGVVEQAYLKESSIVDNYNKSVYGYKVEDVEYTINIYTNSSASIDELVEILYDSINPSVNIEKSIVKDIDNFYSDMFKQALLLYIKIFGLAIIWSALWFCIDILKYNKVLWKQYV